jgi:hypothetical protein
LEDFPGEDNYDGYEEDEVEKQPSLISFSTYIEGPKARVIEADIKALRLLSEKPSKDGKIKRVNLWPSRWDSRGDTRFHIEHNKDTGCIKLVRQFEDLERNVGVEDILRFSKPVEGVEGIEVTWIPDPRDRNTRMRIGLLAESPAELAEKISVAKERDVLEAGEASMEHNRVGNFIEKRAEAIIAESFEVIPVGKSIAKLARFLIRRSYNIKPVKE